MALCLEFVRRRLPMLHLRRADWRITRADISEHLRLGLPMGFQASIIAIGTLTVQVALNTLGADAVAAYTTGSRVDSLAVALLSSSGSRSRCTRRRITADVVPTASAAVWSRRPDGPSSPVSCSAGC